MMSTFKNKLIENFYTVEEFVDYVGIISISGAYVKIREGSIPSSIIENKIYISKKWVKKNYDDVIENIITKVANDD